MTAPLSPRPDEPGQRPVVPLSAEDAKTEAEDIIRRAIADMPGATRHRDETPLPPFGATPPVAQPGRPPMSRRAVDASTTMLCGGVASVLVGGSVSGVLWTSGHADPIVVAMICAGPVGLLLAVSRLVRRVGEATQEHHHHYEGTVTQDHRKVTNHNRWFSRSDSSNGG